MDSKPRCGRPSTSRNNEMIAKVQGKVYEDRCVAIEDIVAEVGISHESVQSIITKDLFMRRVLAKFVTKLLSDQQRENRKEISQDMLECASQDQNFMNTIITGNETWVYSYDSETKLQSSKWKHPSSPRSKKPRQVRSSVN